MEFKRREIVKIYNDALQNSDYVTPFCREDVEHCIPYVHPSIRKERRSNSKIKESRRVATGVSTPIPLHLQKVYKDLGYKRRRYACSRISIS